jgi:hypothetical protein
VSTSEEHTGFIDLASGRAGPYYLPCLSIWWAVFLHTATFIKLEQDSGPIWSLSRAATYVTRAFLEASASTEVEICVARGDCHGHICVCPNPLTHSRLYECPEPSTAAFAPEHKHDWISAKSILSDQLRIPRSELLQTVERNHNTQSRFTEDLLELARDNEAAWHRHVEACVHNKIPVLDRLGHFSKITKAVSEVQ